jgi:serine/threonine protein phosphatase PrpC
VLGDEELAAFMHLRLDGTSMDPATLAKCCDDLIAHCLELKSDDNMTVIAVRLFPPTPAVERRIEFIGGSTTEASEN